MCKGGFITEEGLMSLLNTPTLLPRAGRVKGKQSLSYIVNSPFLIQGRGINPVRKSNGVKGIGSQINIKGVRLRNNL